MRLERRGLGVWITNASVAPTGGRTPLRREAITVVDSFQEAWFLAVRGTRSRPSRTELGSLRLQILLMLDDLETQA